MNFSKIIKTAIKYGPIVYPIIKKVLNNKSKTKVTSTPRSPKR